ncbi:MAG: hypothetical protein AAF382_16360, partial [Pseudomonadota bacterium]
FGSGFLRLVQDGADVLFQADQDGGGDNYQTQVVFQNTNLGDFTDDNFSIDQNADLGFAPDGSGIFGEELEGTNGNDDIAGTPGDDTVIALAGDDTLSGGNGVDSIDGGAGTDSIEGGFGNDLLTGGGDADEFIFNPGEGDDTITDFELGVDVLQLNEGLSVSSFAEADVDSNGSMDTVLELADGTRVSLLDVNGLSDVNDLFS